MIDGSEKHNRVAFELQNSHVCEKGSHVGSCQQSLIFFLSLVGFFSRFVGSRLTPFTSSLMFHAPCQVLISICTMARLLFSIHYKIIFISRQNNFLSALLKYTESLGSPQRLCCLTGIHCLGEGLVFHLLIVSLSRELFNFIWTL